MRKIQLSTYIKENTSPMRLGLVEAKGVVVAPVLPEFESDLQTLIDELNNTYAETALSENPVISKIRRMYREIGWEPTRYRPSSEALVRRLLKGKGLYRVNNIVDYSNLISARYHIPVGLYDTAKIIGDIILDKGREGETYSGISKPAISADGKLVLRDDSGIFGNPTADSARTSIKPDTENVLAIFFCPQSVASDYLQETLERLANCFTKLNSHAVTTGIQSDFI